MKQVCTLCGRTAVNGNLWCQEADCPIGQMPHIFNYGEPFADLEIVKPLTVLRAAAIYEAVRGEDTLLLKVAHDGHQARLKREAEWLMQFQTNKQSSPLLPTLIPAHRGTRFAYGKTVINNRTKYYCLFEHSEGDFLRELLLKNPQPWFQHAGWIAISIAQALQPLHQQGLLHLALSPESIQVRYEPDKKGDIPRIKLLDLGAITDQQNAALYWHPDFVPTAYTAPELLGKRVTGYAATDVYGIGLILYEMLAGQPAYEFRLRDEATIKRNILNGRKQPLNRSDLTTLPDIAQKATAVNPNQRQQSIDEFAQHLMSLFPPIPKEKQKRKWDSQTWTFVIAAAVLIPMLIVIAFILTDATTF